MVSALVHFVAFHYLVQPKRAGIPSLCLFSLLASFSNFHGLVA